MIFLWEVGDILKIHMEICKTAKEVNNLLTYRPPPTHLVFYFLIEVFVVFDFLKPFCCHKDINQIQTRCLS